MKELVYMISADSRAAAHFGGLKPFNALRIHESAWVLASHLSASQLVQAIRNHYSTMHLCFTVAQIDADYDFSPANADFSTNFELSVPYRIE